MKLRYRTPEEITDWRGHDPLPRAAALLPPGLAAQLDASVTEQLAAAREFALASEHPSPEGALDHLYADGLRPRAGAAGTAGTAGTAGVSGVSAAAGAAGPVGVTESAAGTGARA